MPARIVVHGKTRSVIAEVHKHPAYFKAGIKNALFMIGGIVNRETKRLVLSPPKTGIKHRGLPNRSSAPGEAPATQSGELANSQNYKVRGASELEVGEEAPHAIFMELGTKEKLGGMKRRMRIAPRPHLIKAVNAKARDAQSILGNKVRDKL